MEGKFSVGVDLGGTKIAFGLFDKDGKQVGKRKIYTDLSLDAGALMDEICREIHELCREFGVEPTALAGAGFGMPSIIDIKSGYIILTSAIPNLREYYAKRELETRLKIPVFLGNDSHCAALAEHKFGAGRGFDNMLYVAFSTGIACGIILDGKLRRGAFGSAGETGHMLITPDEGEYCGCGNKGCFMSYASGRGINSHIKTWIKNGETTIMLEMAEGDPGKIDGRIIEAAYRKNDEMAVRAINQMAHYLSVLVYNLFIAFNVNCFVFGGGLTRFGKFFFDKVKAGFEHYLTSRPLGEIYFKIAELGSDFGIIGANQLLYLDGKKDETDF